ncbi:MAG: nuclear transport factor 2 family protein [Acidobacteriota bacterium]|nr:nuclear transport factor 2 family protein [Acidobacteriota bacterium]MDH3530213.1 nuclear transport factor 2 family protein [Acidobacteriota bacterium]
MIKILSTALFLILTLTAAAFAQNADSRAIARAKANEKAVKAAFDTLVEGIREVDADKVMSVYHNDPRTLFFNYNGTATIGWENMNTNRKASYEKRKNVTLEITGLRVEVLSLTSAYVSCKWKQTQEYEGNLEQSTGRMTLIFKKWGKDWKVVHLHTSPDSFPGEVVIPPSEKVDGETGNQ